jgi:hypothetical protein
MEERVSKRAKHAPPYMCVVLSMQLLHTPLLYLLSIDSIRYILLDKQWCYIREYNSFPEELFEKTVCYEEVQKPPKIFEHIQRAKKTLELEVFNALYQCYRPENDWVDYLNMGNIPPTNVMQNFDTSCLEDLMIYYDDCQNEEHRRLYIHTLFIYLKTCKTQFYLSLAKLHNNTITRILVWKNYIDITFPEIFYRAYTHLINKEETGLILIAMARNRPIRENVFAQFPKDLLFKIIFPLIRWSYPLNV